MFIFYAGFNVTNPRDKMSLYTEEYNNFPSV